jgi:hypothetical protein
MRPWWQTLLRRKPCDHLHGCQTYIGGVHTVQLASEQVDQQTHPIEASEPICAQ